MSFAAAEYRIRREYRTPYRAADAWIDIVNQVAAEYGVTAAEMMGLSRKVKICAARHHAMYRIRNEVTIDGKPASFPRIGRWFGRDHTTVIQACRNHGKQRNSRLIGVPHEYLGVRYESGIALRSKAGMSQRKFYAKRAAGEIRKL